MMKACRVIGCDAAAHGYSIYCQSHKRTLRRHGSPTQTGVTVHELAPYVAMIERRKSKNPDSPAWAMLVARWETVHDHMKGTLQRFASGRPGNRIEHLAAHHLVTIGADVQPWHVVRTCLAMYLLQDQCPRRFVSDTAFDFQLVRRVRGLTDTNAGTYWDHGKQRTKRVYRDIPPRVIQAMAQPLKEAFGAPGLLVSKKEREEMEKADKEQRALWNALEGLQ